MRSLGRHLRPSVRLARSRLGPVDHRGRVSPCSVEGEALFLLPCRRRLPLATKADRVCAGRHTPVVQEGPSAGRRGRDVSRPDRPRAEGGDVTRAVSQGGRRDSGPPRYADPRGHHNGRSGPASRHAPRRASLPRDPGHGREDDRAGRAGAGLHAAPGLCVFGCGRGGGDAHRSRRTSTPNGPTGREDVRCCVGRCHGARPRVTRPAPRVPDPGAGGRPGRGEDDVSPLCRTEPRARHAGARTRTRDGRAWPGRRPAVSDRCPAGGARRVPHPTP